MRVNSICALVIFVIAFGLRIPLVDTLYNYSFEPDSESCVAVTRSFYFFFKSLSRENAPQTLDTYPNYSDGDFIASAMFANLVRPLSKAGLITAPLGDGDNSLVIFSMRWCGVLFDALSATIAFIILVLLIGDSLIAVVVTLLYYLLNQQTFNIDLIRVDHFALFTGNLAMLAGLLLFRNPRKAGYYMLAGIAAGLVTGTKINFPFYLLIIFLVFVYLLGKKEVSAKNLILLCLCFLLSFAFMYQRWLMYPGHIGQVLRFTWHNGEVWTAFWGTGKYSYYFWDTFFDHGYSTGVALLLAVAYIFFVVLAFVGVVKNESLKLILCLTFLLQSLALMFSPKVDRYGIILPLWISVFLAYGFSWVLHYFKTKPSKAIAQLAFSLFLLPCFCYALKDYSDLKEKSSLRANSIIETRIHPFQWMKDNVKAGSVVAYQFARPSNPPVFQLPFAFEPGQLTCPFLYKDKLLHFYPPNPDSLKQWANYVMINNKETDFLFFMLNTYYHDTTLALRWQNFFNSLGALYPVHYFNSPDANYGLKDVRIYEVNPVPLKKPALISNCHSELDGAVVFKWQLTNFNTDSDYCYEVQIAKDSSFQWLFNGSRNGFPSQYRTGGDPYIHIDDTISVVPAKIKAALLSGTFNSMMHGINPRSPEVRLGAERFFRQVLIYMIDSSATFGQAITACFQDKQNLPRYTELVDSIYKADGDLLNSNVETYLLTTGLKTSEKEITDIRAQATNYIFKPAPQFGHGKTYYWRVRLRYKYTVLSDWSGVNVFKIG